MNKLGIKMGERRWATFPIEGNPHFISVREGRTEIELFAGWEQLPPGTLLSGRLIFGDARVYGRLTSAHTSEGELPVCLELLSTGLERGLERKPDGAPDSARVFSSTFVRAVERFE